MSSVRSFGARRGIVSALIGFLLLIPLGASPASSASGDSAGSGEATYIVRYKPGVNPRAAAASSRGAGVAVERTLTNVFPGMVARMTPSQRASVAKDPRVAAIEEDQAVTFAATQDDPPWGLDRIDQARLPLSGTFSSAKDGTGVDIYVIDTGVRATHADFGGRVVPGFDVIDGDDDAADCHGHGTHVAGTAAGSTYGVAKAATIVPVRVLDCGGGGTTSGIIAGLEWVIVDHESGPAVANMSLGGGASAAMDLAINATIADGITMVVAAGNSLDSACVYSPARVAAAVTVAASTVLDRPAWFTNRGACVDLFAPGLDIPSAWAKSDQATATLSGTSMAAPHVAGAAALVLQGSPKLAPAQVASTLTRGATKNALSGVPRGTVNLLLRTTP